jgi:hypothetical protein
MKPTDTALPLLTAGLELVTAVELAGAAEAAVEAAGDVAAGDPAAVLAPAVELADDPDPELLHPASARAVARTAADGTAIL